MQDHNMILHMDPMYQKAVSFMKNFKHRNHNNGISNVYILRTIDDAGNIIDEKYGMNLMTDYGMTQYFSQHVNFPTNIYIGKGSGAFNNTTNTLIDPISTTSSTISNSTKSFAYPLYYDNVTGTITCICKYVEAYFPATISDVSTDVDITEYGIGTAYNALWTHSWVYNSIGERDTITKPLNTRLDITVFFCMSYSESLISNAWSEGKCIAITTMERFFNGAGSSSYVTMQDSNIKTFRRFDVATDRTVSNRTSSAFIDNKITITTNMASLTITRDQNESNEYIDGLASLTSGFVMLENVNVATPINFDLVANPTPSKMELKDGFSYGIGAVGNIPFSQCDIVYSYSYNYNTGLYDNPDIFRASPKCYTDTTFGPNFAIPIWYTNNNTIQKIYLYINMNTSDPITAIEGNVSTVYATNSYWDKSSWTLITDLANVPANIRNAKYWLSPVNNTNLKPKRASQTFEFLSDVSTPTPTLSFSQMSYGATRTYVNDVYGWFILGSKAYNMTNGSEFQFTLQGNTGWTHCLPFGYQNTAIFVEQYRISYADLTGDPITQNSITRTNTVATSDRHITESKTGYIIMHGNSSYSNTSSQAWKFEKYDFTTSGSCVETDLGNAIDAACIMLTTNYVYIDTTDPHSIYVKSLVDDSLVQTFSIPSDKASPSFVFGYRDHVYITDGSTYCYLGNVTSGTLTLTSGSIPEYTSGANRSISRCIALDECMIVYNDRENTTLSRSCLVAYKDPTVLHSLSSINPYGYNSNYGIQLNLAKYNTNTIILLLSETDPNWSSGTGMKHFGYDLGRMIDNNTFTTSNAIAFEPRSPMSRMIPFENYMICGNETFSMGNFLNHRLVGTTNTATSYDAYKNISNKSWTLTVTNLGSYQGFPPGSQQ